MLESDKKFFEDRIQGMQNLMNYFEVSHQRNPASVLYEVVKQMPEGVQTEHMRKFRWHLENSLFKEPMFWIEEFWRPMGKLLYEICGDSEEEWCREVEKIWTRSNVLSQN